MEEEEEEEEEWGRARTAGGERGSTERMEEPGARGVSSPSPAIPYVACSASSSASHSSRRSLSSID
jgi:hypothetical protein